MPESPDSLRACMGVRRVSARWGGWVKTVVYLSILRDIRLLFRICLLDLGWEVSNEPISDGCGHLAKIVFPGELVIGVWQEVQPLRSFQCVMQSLALMEGDTLVLFTLDNQCGNGDSFSRSIGDLPEAVIVKIIPQTDSIRSSHNVRNRVRGLPPSQLVSAKR